MQSIKTMPTCIGFIMDGNRRWAKQHAVSLFEAHAAGAERFKDAIGWVRESGVSHMVCYAFSTENWDRPKDEVQYLIELFRKSIADLAKVTDEGSTSIRFIGQRDRFPEDLRNEMERIEACSQEGTTCTVWIALSYGGRAEILEAVNRAVQNGKEVDEHTFARLLWSADMPDPDLIIRTSGEKRLSNFLPWQSVYSELFFTDTLWPDFSLLEFQGILEAYAERKRRRGV